MGHVFVSYSSKDHAYVHELTAFLQREDIEVWFDKEIELGDRWLSVVARQIDTCAAFVVVMSPDSDESEWVEREIVRAEHGQKEILPLLLRGDPIMRLNDRQYVSVVGHQMPSSRFVAKLRELTTPVVVSPRPSQTALEVHQVDYSSARRRREGWSDAPHVDRLYGRDEVTNELGRWIVADRVRIVAVLGIGGVGKTAVAARVAHRIRNRFDYVFGCSLYNAPPLNSVMQRATRFLSDQRRVDIPSDVDSQIDVLAEFLRASRCLIVLDNFDAILQEDDEAGRFRPGYEGYGLLLRRAGETQHQSCVLFTSREKPREIAQLEGRRSGARSMELRGLDHAAGQALIHDNGLIGSDAACKRLIELYGGNPLALTIVSETVRETCGGEIDLFLRQGDLVFGDVLQLIQAQFDRLTALEQEIMFWLAIERDVISLDELRLRIVRPLSRGALIAAMASLRRRYVVEAGATAFALQPVVAEHVTDHFIRHVCDELIMGAPQLLGTHSLVRADAKDHVKNDQFRVILQEVLEELLRYMGEDEVEQKIKNVISKVRGKRSSAAAYAAGNCINLLVGLKADLRGYDLSNLDIRHACLQRVTLIETTLAHSNLETSVFAENFDVVLSVAFSPDGQLLATGAADGEIRLWQAINNLPFTTCYGHTGRVRSVAFSPDGRVLASGGDDQMVRIWDVRTGVGLHVLRGHSQRVRSVAFSPDGRVVASAGHDKVICLWDVASGAVRRTLRGHAGEVRAVTFGARSPVLASAGDDEAVCLWDVDSGDLLRRLQGVGTSFLSIALSKDGTLIAAGGANNSVWLWDAVTGRLLHELAGHAGPVRSVAFSPDGKLIVSGSEDWTVRLWDVGSGHTLTTLVGHSNRVYSVSVSPDGQVVASGSEDHTVRLWELASGKLQSTFDGYTNWVWSIAYGTNGSVLASGSDDQMVRLWDARTLRPVLVLPGHTNRVRSVAFSPDGELLASGSDDHSIRVWAGDSGHLLHTLRGHDDRVRALGFSPDGRFLMSGSDDRTVCLWESRTGRRLHTMRGHTAWLRSVAFSSDGHVLCSGAEDGTIRLWDPTTGEPVGRWQAHVTQTYSVAFSPDGTLLASSGNDGSVRIWDVESRALIRALDGHNGSVRSVVFSPDGTLLASGSDDHTVRVWDAYDGGLLQTLHGHSKWVFSVVFSPDGSVLASGSEDGTIVLWRVKHGTMLDSVLLDRQYERMDITDVEGLSDAQKVTLRALGAVETRETSEGSSR